MASLSYVLMNAFHDKAKSLQSENKFDESFAWDSCESTVNNVHHGRYPQEWLPMVKGILEHHLESETEENVKPVWIEAIAMTDEYISQFPKSE